jgi:hypothetical protein
MSGPYRYRCQTNGTYEQAIRGRHRAGHQALAAADRRPTPLQSDPDVAIVLRSCRTPASNS